MWSHCSPAVQKVVTSNIDNQGGSESQKERLGGNESPSVVRRNRLGRDLVVNRGEGYDYSVKLTAQDRNAK
jgi:hypothetical protein